MEAIVDKLLKPLWGSVFNSSKILWLLFYETLKAILLQLPWRIVLERFLTRLVVALLKWLKSLSSNLVVDETIKDILYALRKKGLPQAKL